VSTIGWVIVLVLVIPALGLLLWLVFAESVVRVPAGRLGLLMIKGRATDTALLPGPHFVPALRRRMVEEYPAVELAYRAGAPDEPGDPELNQAGPGLPVILGDRTSVVVSLTVRFRLRPDGLRTVHERFGPRGIFGNVRDQCQRAVIATLGAPGVGVDNLFGPARTACEESLREQIGDVLNADGIELISVLLGVVDLGRVGEVIQDTMRARYEVEREAAEAATRLARAQNDTELQRQIGAANDVALRYRETDLWRELVQRTEGLQVELRAPTSQPGVDVTAPDRPPTNTDARRQGPS
jgi:regulator of protease activity HflC (stomatin/prohibitin superfamily)